MPHQFVATSLHAPVQYGQHFVQPSAHFLFPSSTCCLGLLRNKAGETAALPGAWRRLTPFRRFRGKASEFFHGLIVGLRGGRTLGFANRIAALLAEVLDGLGAPAGAAA